MGKLMGYQGRLFYGEAGATAELPVLNRVDATMETGVEIGSTTSAGDGESVPINTGEATALTGGGSFNMIVEENDAAMVAILAAARTGTPIALAFYANTGQIGFDADCVISATQGAPLKGEQTLDISIEALSASLREPDLNATQPEET